MPELTPEQRAQLDKNIRSMLDNGASEQDVIPIQPTLEASMT